MGRALFRTRSDRQEMAELDRLGGRVRRSPALGATKAKIAAAARARAAARRAALSASGNQHSHSSTGAELRGAGRGSHNGLCAV